MPLTPLPLDVTRAHQVRLSGPPEAPSLAGVFSGGETFEVLLLPGDDLPAVATLPAEWDPSVADNPAGLDSPVVRVTFDAPALAAAGVLAGIYRVRGRLNPASDRLLFLDDVIELRPAPGTGTPPKVYCSRADLLDILGTVEGALDLTNQKSGFAEARNAARAWTDRTVLARAGDVEATRARLGRSSPFGTAGTDAVRAALDADRLLVDDTVRRANAFYSLGEILAPSLGGEIGQYGTTARQKLGLQFRSRAIRLLIGWTAKVDVDGDSVYELSL